jgi:leader peptidase (prepilin peptidase)/N-methyltransferase
MPLESTFIFLAFIFGTIVGSFLNVVILRLNTGVSIAADRSRCFSCGKTLAWYELVPLFSFLVQGGRCRSCGAKISWQYPLVELATGLLFGLIFYLHPFISTLGIFSSSAALADILYAAIWSTLVVILVYDLRHKIIPDMFSVLFAVLGLILLFIQPTGGFHVPSILQLAAGPLLALPFFLLWLVSRGQWLGLGDAKLAWGIGWFLGVSQGAVAIIFGFWLGAIVGIVLIILKKLQGSGQGAFGKFFQRVSLFLGLNERILKSEIPFAPFLVAGVLIVFITHIDAARLVLFF